MKIGRGQLQGDEWVFVFRSSATLPLSLLTHATKEIFLFLCYRSSHPIQMTKAMNCQPWHYKSEAHSITSNSLLPSERSLVLRIFD